MASPVPFVDLASQHAPIRAELRDAFDRVVDASAFILGEEVERFESEFADYCGTRHCVGVASGTAALTLAALAAGIERGDEVIVPAHTFIASALGMLHAGATPVFCEVEEGTGLIDLDSARERVTARTRAVLPVHLYGQACDMGAVGAFAEEHGLLVIEDAAQAHGATFADKRVGAFGTAAAFSFYPSKNLGALGDGGAITTDDDDLAERARILRHLGQRGKGEHVLPGYNERLDGLHAAMLRVKLRHLDGWNEARRRHAAAYREGLPDRCRLLEEKAESPCIYHLFPVRVEDRDGVAERLRVLGVHTGVHYAPSVPEQPPFHATNDPGMFPVSGSWARDELSLPMYDALEAPQVAHVIQACAEAVT